MITMKLFRLYFSNIICITIAAMLAICPPVHGQEKKTANDILIIRDIGYKNQADAVTNTMVQNLDVYRRRDASSKKKPVIIFVHGGGFWEGDKRSELYIKMATAFAKDGYVAFSINYRLKAKNQPYSNRILDTCIADVAAALTWIRMNNKRFGIDTTKIFICGDSAGGGIIINTCYDPLYSRYFKGCIDLWGGIPGEKGWEAPIYNGHFTQELPPTCIIHGNADKIIPYETSSNLSVQLAAAKVYHELFPLQGADHYPVQLADQFIPLMMAFADKIIKKKIK